MKGAFIVFEGADGAGKSSLCKRVAEWLTAKGRDVVLTAEPTHEGIGAFIRSGNAGEISQRTEALLFVADRNDHTEKIMRMVEEGKIVLSDRYFASTVAYQSARLDGDASDRDWLIDINRQFIDRPDATILLDIDPEVGMSRVGDRGEEISKFERMDFQKQVRENYLRLAKEFGFNIVDASRSRDEVYMDTIAILEEVIE
ncbi:MAG: dTMP kinase [Candidatus Methanomethylophilaceae archaeon]|nr:dTMP kinase [Candidatus Methanomethylophilaceae archaeon]